MVDQNLAFDSSKCIKCGACARACPAKLIEMSKEGPVETHPETCILCGHCVGVCPSDAVSHLKMDSADFLKVQNPQISFDQIFNLTRNRRSIRNFKPKPVEKEKIEQILNSIRYIPTGENAQELEYLVISDPEIIKNIKDAMAKKFKLFNRLLHFFLIYGVMRMVVGKTEAVRLQSSLVRVMDEYKEGADPFLRGAPTLIIIITKQKQAMQSLDAGIAGYHINLESEVLGIGSCWIGFHSALAQFFKSIRKVSKIPPKYKVLATIGIGYSLEKYQKTCARPAVNTFWIGQ